jgi:hypothetical protein
MPKVVSEVTQGVSYTFNGTDPQNAVQTTRTFKIIKNSPSENINIQQVCGVFVGNPHPVEPGLYCSSLNAQYDGDSRMYIVVTFNYDTAPTTGGQPPTAPPVREANWSVSTSLIEVPAYVWKPITGPNAGQERPIANPVGDLYEGVTRLEALVTISVTQFEEIDPTRHCLFAGAVNQSPLKIGSLSCPSRSVMFRGVQTSPAIETFGGAQYSGWTANYEFAYRRNYVGAPVNAAIGWDWAQPVSGFNVRAFNPGVGGGQSDVFGQPLKHEGGKVVTVPALALPATVSAGDKVRGCVKIFEREDGGVTQRASSQPIALNDDGTPRLSTATPPVNVYRYQVQQEVDFSIFGLRLT